MKPTDSRPATDPDDGPPRALLVTYFGAVAVLVATLVGLTLHSDMPDPVSVQGASPPAASGAPVAPDAGAGPPELPAPAGDEMPGEWPPSF